MKFLKYKEYLEVAPTWKDLSATTQSPYRPYEFGHVAFFSNMEMPEKQLIKKEMKRLFDYREDYKELTAWDDLKKPIVMWDFKSDIDDSGVTHRLDGKAVWYNYPDGITVSKPDVIKDLQRIKCPHTPKTYFTREDAKKNLEFPIIAKASNTFQSRGVELVKSAKELDELPGGFDLYQEAINIAEEFRILFFRGHELYSNRNKLLILAAFRRDPLNKKAKSLRVDEAGMFYDRLMDRPKSDFAWTHIDLYNYPKLEIPKLYELAQHVFEVNPTLNITGIDVAVDKDGKYWFIEHNTTPGLFSNQAVLIFRAVYEDCIGELSPIALSNLTKLSHLYAQLTEKEESGFSVQSMFVLDNLHGYE